MVAQIEAFLESTHPPSYRCYRFTASRSMLTRKKLSTFLPMMLISGLTWAAVVSVFGVFVWATHLWNSLNDRLFKAAHKTPFVNLCFIVTLLAALAVMLMILGLVLNKLLGFLVSSFVCQLLAVVIALFIGIRTQEKHLERALLDIERDYDRLPVTEFESRAGCSGVRAHGCVSGCCDESLRMWLSDVYTDEKPLLIAFGLLWVLSMSLLLPLATVVCAKKLEDNNGWPRSRRPQ